MAIRDAYGQGRLALSVSVPVARITRKRLAAILAESARGSLAISRRAGAPGEDPRLAALADPAAAATAIDALAAAGRYGLSLPG